MKDLGKVKTIIKWQITRDLVLGIIKIDQVIFIRNLVIEEDFINCNTTVILMKTNSVIDMLDVNDYKEIKLYKY